MLLNLCIANSSRSNLSKTKILRNHLIQVMRWLLESTKKVSRDNSNLTFKFLFFLGMEDKFSICLYPGTGTVDGKFGDHVMICPAYIVTRSEVELIVDKATQVVEDYFAKRQL
jgi:hypothetical protein